MRRTPLAVLVLSAALASPASAHAADSCPNARFRSGAAANLADCRAWEQVSPVDKNGVGLPDGLIGATEDRVSFVTLGPVAGADAGPILSTSVAARSTQWTTRGVEAPFTVNNQNALYLSSTFDLSEDLTTGLVISDRKLADGAIEGGSNLYSHDLTTGAYRLVYGTTNRDLFNFNTYQSPIVGRTADLSGFAFATSVPLTPDSLSGSYFNLYQWDGRALRLASILPDGRVARFNGGGPRRSTLSSDGRRLTAVLSDDTTQQATYQRVDGRRTVLISRSHRDGDDPTEPRPASTFFPSPDGTQVIFEGDGLPLTNESPARNDFRLYRWSADGDRLEDLLVGVVPDGTPAQVTRLVRVSTDLRYVWFRTSGALRPGDPETGSLYVLDAMRGRLTAVANSDISEPGFDPSGSRITYVEPGGDLFSFDAATPAALPVCVTCGTADQPVGGNVSLSGSGVNGNASFEAFPVTDDGRVFFSTPARLAAADSNQVSDVYEFRPGQGLTLVSSGTGGNPATFRQTTPSGRDVLFQTAQPLVPQDTDGLADVYDARVDGGLAAQQVAPSDGFGCATDSCRDPAAPGAERPRPAPAAPGPREAVSFSLGRPTAAQRRSAARTGRLDVGVRTSTSGKITIRARARLAGRVRAAGSGSRTAKRAGTATVTVRLSTRVRRALRAGRRVTLSLSASFSPTATRRSLSVTLKRPSVADRKGSR